MLALVKVDAGGLSGEILSSGRRMLLRDRPAVVAAAHAACFAMALSGALGRAGTPPERLDVSAEVTFDKLEAGWRVVSSALTVRGRVPGMSAADFEAAAESTKDGCPISQAISVEATLEG